MGPFGSGMMGGFGSGLQQMMLKRMMAGPGAAPPGAAPTSTDPMLPQNQMPGTVDEPMIAPQYQGQAPGMMDSLKSRLMGLFGGR